MSGLERAVRKFLYHLEVERGLSAYALEAYNADLTRFCRTMIRRHGARVRAEDVTKRNVLSYLKTLQKAGMAAESQRRHLGTVRRFFRHLKDRELVAINPIEATPPAPRVDPRTDDEVRAALRQHNNNRAAAARSLGVSRTTLYERARVLGLLRSTDKLTKEEILDAHAQYDGNTERTAVKLGVSPRALKARLGAALLRGR